MERYLVLDRYDTVEVELLKMGLRTKKLMGSGRMLIEVELREDEVHDMSKLIFDSIKAIYIGKHLERYVKEKSLKRELGGFLIKEIKTRSLSYIEENNIEERVTDDISKYIFDNELVNIYGVMRFRLGYYREHIESSVEKAMYDMSIDEESRNLTEAIRYLGELQKSRQKKMSIIFSKKGYDMVDENGENIDSDRILSVARELGIDDLDKEETIIGALIANAPDKIHIYREDNVEEDIIDIIENIFKGKVKIHGSYKRRLSLASENI